MQSRPKLRRGPASNRSGPRVSASGDRVITLLTDFGTADYFVGAVKGAILSVNPAARIVDITHEIPAHDVEDAAFTLLAAFQSFPAGTIHVAVVDPGVGSARRGILIRARQQSFIGPDNGIFSYICDGSDIGAVEIFHLNKAEYFRRPVSQTFNGRDVFAPVAAALSTGIEPVELGTRVSGYIRLPSITPERSEDGKVNARIIHIDRFGNCVTNITSNQLSEMMIKSGAGLRVNGKLIKTFRNFYAEETRAQLFAIWGSAGFLELAAANKSAAQLLQAKRGDAVILST